MNGYDPADDVRLLGSTTDDTAGVVYGVRLLGEAMSRNPIVNWLFAYQAGRMSVPSAAGRDMIAGNAQKGRGILTPALVGVFVFCLGGGVLWLTNLERFGNGFEFGHKLNLQRRPASMYATRFDDPFQDQPIAGAAKELFGILFFDNQIRTAGPYHEKIFPGQSETLRRRELYFRTFDWTYLALMLMGWWAATASLRGKWPLAIGGNHGVRHISTPDQTLVTAAGLWSLTAAVPLLGFYLYTPVISSRYMLDLAPAFAAAIACAWLWLTSRCQRRWSRVMLCLILCGWFGVEGYLDSSVSYGPVSMDWEQLKVKRDTETANPDRLPLKFNQDVLGDGGSGIPFDRVGWDQETGMVKPLVILFIKDPEFLELELETEDHPRIKPNPEDIRAKVGLEDLQRERITRTEKGWKIEFTGPRQRRWRTGLQCVFVATVPKEFLTEHGTPWVLKRVAWRPK